MRLRNRSSSRFATAASVAVGVLWGGVLCGLASPGAAQELERVEEIWGDAGPLNESLRQLPLDMRRPSGFEHLYRVPGSKNLLTRMDGSLAAVFPRSVYSSSPNGVIPVIPPGTVFYVGGLPDESYNRWGGGQMGGASMFKPHPQRSPINRTLAIHTPIVRMPTVALRSTNATHLGRSEPVPTIWSDEFYRRDRITHLLGVVRVREELRVR